MTGVRGPRGIVASGAEPDGRGYRFGIRLFGVDRKPGPGIGPLLEDGTAAPGIEAVLALGACAMGAAAPLGMEGRAAVGNAGQGCGAPPAAAISRTQALPRSRTRSSQLSLIHI